MVSAETHRIPIVGNESICLGWYPKDLGARTAIFLHGLGSNRRGEKALHFAECFNKQGWAFAALDLRGHGDSDGLMRDLTMSRMLADVHATRLWLEARGVAERPVLIGASMGAAVIAWYALQHECEVDALIMIAPAPNENGNHPPRSRAQ